ncbi:MAG: hypothetical protein HY796_12525 [Elusimicrobia bacterium]|nr:hypothetical protein [Elusimicrobiota bacterium]
MKIIFLCICFLGAYVYNPDALSGQESLLMKTLKENSGLIYAIAFSSDAKYVASGGVDTFVRIWRAEDGSCVKMLKGHKSFINSVAFSPDGAILASAGEDGAIKLWNAETGDCIRTLKGHNDPVSSVVFFPDGGRIASASNDGTIKLWRLKSKAPYKTIKTRSGYVYSVAVSSDGTRLASGNADRTIKTWNAESGLRETTFEGHLDAVNSVSFSRTANYLASGSEDGAVKVWRLSDGICVKTFAGQNHPIFTVSYSPDGNYVFAGGSDNIVSAWRVSDGNLTRTFSGHNGQVKSLAFSPDGKYLASGSFDKTIKLWLTPWEAERRDREAKEKDAMEVERNKNYDLHYSAGVQLLSSPTRENLEKAVAELTQALSYKATNACKEKLNEAVNAQRRKEEQIKRRIKLSIEGAIALSILLLIVWVVAGAKKKARLRRTLPDAIKSETLSGSYETALRLYVEYKAIGGDLQNLPQDELLELYRGLQALNELPKENIPYNFLLSYAVTMANESNYKLALIMLRSGRLLNEFKTPGEFDTFVEIYGKAGRPENLLMLKLNPSTYSALAEAFFKVKDYDDCEKVCALKKQFYPDKMSPRDAELLSACQKNREELQELKKNAVPKWRCINCGYIHKAREAPESCPGCMHPREHFQIAEN